LWREAVRRFRRHRLAMIGATVLLVLVGAVVAGPLAWRLPVNEIDFTQKLKGPTWGHPLGTDDLGQDLLARVLYGGRLPLAAGGPGRPGPVPVAPREGVRRGGTEPRRAAAQAGRPAHPAQLDGAGDRRGLARRRRRDHRGVHALVPGPRLPSRYSDLGAAPVRRQGQPGLRPPLGHLPGHGDLPHRPLHQLHRRRVARRARPEKGLESMTDTDLCFTPATELAALIRRHKVSPLEVTRAALARIEKVNPSLNAYCTVAAEQALADAKRATGALKRGARLGPLHGVPVSIKDLTLTRGIRTTEGSKIFEHRVPAEAALVVARLKAAGAIVLGKTNTPEFGAGANTFNAVFGPTRNPWNPALTCGGSSGGAAVALATGMGPIAQGSDTGGSLRTPAAFCGVVGFRTTPGLVPYYPKLLGWDSIGVTGPMARTVGDTALMLSVVAGPDDR